MAVDGILKSLPGAVAGGDLSSAQYTFGKITAAYTVDQCDAAGEVAHGVIYTNPDAAGKTVQFVVSGVVKVVAGAGGLTAGDAVATTAAGAAVTATIGNIILGWAMKDAAAGTIAEVLMLGAAGGTA